MDVNGFCLLMVFWASLHYNLYGFHGYNFIFNFFCYWLIALRCCHPSSPSFNCMALAGTSDKIGLMQRRMNSMDPMPLKRKSEFSTEWHALIKKWFSSSITQAKVLHVITLLVSLNLSNTIFIFSLFILEWIANWWLNFTRFSILVAEIPNL